MHFSRSTAHLGQIQTLKSPSISTLTFTSSHVLMHLWYAQRLSTHTTSTTDLKLEWSLATLQEHDDSRRQAAMIPDNLSPAVVSRLTLIHVTPPTLDEMRTEFGCVLRRRMNHEHADAGVELMFAILLKLADLYPRMVASISLRRLLQWCDYAKLDRQLAACRAGSSDELIANLVLGGQILLLDGLGPAQRAAAVDALSAIEANYAANAAEQHACPGAVAGSVGHTSWINKTARGTWLTYLGFKLNDGVDTAITFGGFEPSASAVRNLSRLLAARDTGHPINLVGPPGVGKSAVVEAAAKLLGRPFVRISCSRSLTVDDLFGSYRPSLDEVSFPACSNEAWECTL